MTARTKVVRRLVELAKNFGGHVLPYSDDRAVVIDAQKFNAIRECGAKLVMLDKAARPKFQDTTSPSCCPQPKDTGTGTAQGAP